MFINEPRQLRDYLVWFYTTTDGRYGARFDPLHDYEEFFTLEVHDDPRNLDALLDMVDAYIEQEGLED